MKKTEPQLSKLDKKPYVSPVLVGYGTVAKLTRSSGTKNGEGTGGMMP